MSGQVTADGDRAALAEIRVNKEFAALLERPQNYEQIRDDVQARGIVLPLLLTRDGLLIDGHTRRDIAEELGLSDVPVVRLPIDSSDARGDMRWLRALALTLNCQRRHLTEGQIAKIGMALLALEKDEAKQRQEEGARKGRCASTEAQPTPDDKSSKAKRGAPEQKATARVAKKLGIGRATVERTAFVEEHGSEELNAKVASGEVSPAKAVRTIKIEQAKEQAKVEEAKVAAEPKVAKVDGLFSVMEQAPAATYRCIYADPPWAYRDDGTDGSAATQYKTMEASALHKLGAEVQRVAHPDGSHLWMWTTWPMIREGQPQAVLEAWGYGWTSEAVWHKAGRLATGRSLRVQTEVLILATRGSPMLLNTDQRGYIEAPIQGHSVKPAEARALVERLSPGPRLEMFARELPPGWHGFGNQLKRVEAQVIQVESAPHGKPDAEGFMWGVAPANVIEPKPVDLTHWGGTGDVTLFASRADAHFAASQGSNLIHRLRVTFEPTAMKRKAAK